jgi:hypothetical protein
MSGTQIAALIFALLTVAVAAFVPATARLRWG